jgi:hypothetical protein
MIMPIKELCWANLYIDIFPTKAISLGMPRTMLGKNENENL